jgi:lysophospholipase L1-like esterase
MCLACACAPLLVAACGSDAGSARAQAAPADPAVDAAAPVVPSAPVAPQPTPSVPLPDAAGGPLDSGGWSCRAPGNQVVMIGDSYLALSGDVTTQLLRYARGAGALGETEAYRTYYVSGTQMSGGIIGPNIPAQFQEAVTADPHVRFVVMDGGGNDILVGNSGCITTQPPPGNASCAQTVEDAIAAANALFSKMKAAGVEKVVYFFYPHLPTAGKPYVNETVDYAFPLVEAACDSAPVPCYFVDLRPAFDGHPEYIGPDGIHPTTAGSDVIALLLWEKMQEACIAQ